MRIIRRDPNKAYLSTWLEVPKKLINTPATMSALSFQMKDRYTEEATVIQLWKEAAHHLLVPRAFWEPSALPCEVVDCRPTTYQHVGFSSRVVLDHRLAEVGDKKILQPTGDNVQALSIDALWRSQGGVLQLACGRGKTVIALEHIVRRGFPALILLDNMNLLRQWEQDIVEFLDVPGGVGFLHAGKFEWKKNLVLATYHTVAGRADELPEEIRRWFGTIIWDEGHHMSAPLFSRTATAFYGQRIALTATPKRADGYHIICDFHVGKVIHKDLRPMMKPKLIFAWTGIALDLTNMDVHKAVCDVNGEVHLSKVESYLAGYKPWLYMLLQGTIDAATHNRRILVLTDSVAEAANLFAMWTRGYDTSLYTDIPLPTSEEVGELIEPLHLPAKQLRELADRIKKHWRLANGNGRFTVDADEANRDMVMWTRTLVQKKLVSELEKRRRKFLKDLLKEKSTAGIMTYRVPDEERQSFIETRQVVFAITKYGKEGLDSPRLDTVIVSSLFSDPAGLQQLMGRPTRPSPGKKTPTVLFYVHNIGQCIGMAKKLQQHLREWPHDEGGPYEYELFNHPGARACKMTSLAEAFGR